jgi:uncharacterized protein
MATQKQIRNFLDRKKFALAGLSRNTKEFSHVVYKKLLEMGFDVYPINPHVAAINNITCYTSLRDIPEDVDHVLVLTSKNHSYDLVKEAIETGKKNLWIQQFSSSKEAIKLAEDFEVNLIHNECIMMHLEPVKGIHAFHRSLRKFFGTYPK